MKRIVTVILTFIVLIIGVLIVFTSPLDPSAIIVGMFLVSVAILNLAVQIYFPPSPQQEVELKVVEEPVEVKEAPKKELKVRKKTSKPRSLAKPKRKR
jgi:uncharacterized protein (DUF58 family)